MSSSTGVSWCLRLRAANDHRLIGWPPAGRSALARSLGATVNVKLAIVSLVALLGVSACSDDLEGSSADQVRTIELSADLTSSNNLLRNVNTGDSVVYGWNLLEGEATLDAEPVEVQMLGNVDYISGSGDFFGFVTFVFADDSTIGVRMTGEATAASDTSNATFVSSLVVVGGTGRYLDATGTGTFTGERQDALGGQVSSDFTLALVTDEAG